MQGISFENEKKKLEDTIESQATDIKILKQVFENKQNILINYIFFNPYVYEIEYKVNGV